MPGLLIVALWFILIAAYLLWQFATSALESAEAFEPDPAPVPVHVESRSPAAPVAAPLFVRRAATS